jgi:hypothetical protein
MRTYIVRPNGQKPIEIWPVLSLPPLDEMQSLWNPFECETIRVECFTAMLNDVLR